MTDKNSFTASEEVYTNNSSSTRDESAKIELFTNILNASKALKDIPEEVMGIALAEAGLTHKEALMRKLCLTMRNRSQKVLPVRVTAPTPQLEAPTPTPTVKQQEAVQGILEGINYPNVPERYVTAVLGYKYRNMFDRVGTYTMVPIQEVYNILNKHNNSTDGVIPILPYISLLRYSQHLSNVKIFHPSVNRKPAYLQGLLDKEVIKPGQHISYTRLGVLVSALYGLVAPANNGASRAGYLDSVISKNEVSKFFQHKGVSFTREGDKWGGLRVPREYAGVFKMMRDKKYCVRSVNWEAFKELGLCRELVKFIAVNRCKRCSNNTRRAWFAYPLDKDPAVLPENI